MPSSSHHAKHPDALTLKQAANWQCNACGRLCRHHGESLDNFAIRIRRDADDIAAHPRRWTLHVTRVYRYDSMGLDTLDNATAKTTANKTSAQPTILVLCGSCHRTHHNHRRWQQRQQQRRQQQESIGQLTLSDIHLPLAGLQLSFNEWGTPYEIVNPQPRKKRLKTG